VALGIICEIYHVLDLQTYLNNVSPLVEAERKHIREVFHEFKQNFSTRYQLLFAGQRQEPDTTFFMPWFLQVCTSLVHYKKRMPDYGSGFTRATLSKRLRDYIKANYVTILDAYDRDAGAVMDTVLGTMSLDWIGDDFTIIERQIYPSSEEMEGVRRFPHLTQRLIPPSSQDLNFGDRGW
jgi:hypothetical protein